MICFRIGARPTSGEATDSGGSDQRRVFGWSLFLENLLPVYKPLQGLHSDPLIIKLLSDVPRLFNTETLLLD